MNFNLFLLLSFSIILQSVSAQNIYKYEHEISDKSKYNFTEVNFENTNDDIILSGTLISPKGNYDKIIMIVPGSGKDTRHSHFILTEKFLKSNIAVYRFDERGIGKSEGKYSQTATTLMNDVVFAYQKLRTIKNITDKKIGILGHSLGGIASIGAFGKGCDFDFLIQMATPVERDGAFFKYQATTNISGFYSVPKKTTAEVINFLDSLSQIASQNNDYKLIQKKAKQLMKSMNFKKGRYFVNEAIIDLMQQNHKETYKNCQAPILFIIGTSDRIVSSDAETNALRKLNNSKTEIKIIENVNHYLNDRFGPTKIEHDLYQMNPKAIKEIIGWALKN